MKPKPAGILLCMLARRLKALHADDLGVACVFALERWSVLANDARKDVAGQPLAFLNVGTGVDQTLAEQIAAVVGFTGDLIWDKSNPRWNTEKASRLQAMGWTASISLTQGLERTYKSFQTSLAKKQLRVD